LKKDGGGLVLDLVATPDILAGLVAGRRPGQVVVGFAAETGDSSASVIEHGRAKLARKGCDLLVVNDVRGDRAFGSPDNEVTILGAGTQVHVPRAAKSDIADAVWDAVLALARP
jgi:phosphopantothenoylcysteine decarboxylase/phosphopantothenate--cysteine ligase